MNLKITTLSAIAPGLAGAVEYCAYHDIQIVDIHWAAVLIMSMIIASGWYETLKTLGELSDTILHICIGYSLSIFIAMGVMSTHIEPYSFVVTTMFIVMAVVGSLVMARKMVLANRQRKSVE